MAPQTPEQQIATLPIQVPPKEHLSLNEMNITHNDYRGKALCAKLRIQRETADQLVAQLVHGKTDRGGCKFVCKRRQRNKSQEWRLSCCFGDHDKSARKAAASAGQPLLFKAAEGAAPNTPGVAAVQKVQDNDVRSGKTNLGSRRIGARNWRRGNLSRSAANLH
jgi:hypothetical protein